jgi:hypothetical protein
MRNLLLYFCLCFLTISATYGQNRWGLYGHKKGTGSSIIMLGAGPAYLYGDVGGKQLSGLFKASTLNPKSTRNFISLGYRYIFPNNLSLRFNALYGSFVGTDSLTILQARKYNFTSNVLEISFQGEWFIIGSNYGYYNNEPHSLYVFAGAGNVTYMPTLTGNSRMEDVIKTETGNAPIIPFGIGYEYYIGNGFSLGSEFAFRYAFSDFLDGLKTPYSNSNDLLVNLNFTVSYNFSLSRY